MGREQPLCRWAGPRKSETFFQFPWRWLRKLSQGGEEPSISGRATALKDAIAVARLLKAALLLSIVERLAFPGVCRGYSLALRRSFFGAAIEYISPTKVASQAAKAT